MHVACDAENSVSPMAVVLQAQENSEDLVNLQTCLFLLTLLTDNGKLIPIEKQNYD